MSYSIEPAYTMVMELSRQLVLPKSEQLHNIEHVHATAARLVVHHRHHGLVGTLGTVIRKGILLKIWPLVSARHRSWLPMMGEEK